jgi:hypothetical protein
MCGNALPHKTSGQSYSKSLSEQKKLVSFLNNAVVISAGERWLSLWYEAAKCFF